MANKEVLIVDDEEIVLEILDRTLSKHGFSITVKSCSTEALDHLAQKKYSVLISDICMPGINGLDFIEKARSINPNMKAIAITGYGTDDRLMKCIEMDCYGYVDKPFNVDYMVALVSSAFD